MVSKALRKCHSAWVLSRREKLWFLFLYPYSGLVRIATLLVPFKWMSRYLGTPNSNLTLSTLATDRQILLARSIGRIVALTAKYTPWESNCLVQAIMARTLLGFYGIPYIMHLGVRLTGEDSDSLKAHAWIKVGPAIVVGGGNLKAYGLVGTFVASEVIADHEKVTHRQSMV